MYGYLRALVDSYESIQGARIEGENKIRAINQEFDEPEPVRIRVMEHLEGLRKIEHSIMLDVHSMLRKEPIWIEFLEHVKGIGPSLAGKLLALNLDPSRNLSSWNAYFGLTTHYWIGTCGRKGHDRFYAKDPLTCLIQVEKNPAERIFKICGEGITEKEHIEGSAPKRKRGYQKFWNSRARDMIYLISTQFLMGGRYYKEQYYHFREREDNNRPQLSDGQRHNSARRKAVQLFIAHLYQATHEINGTEARIPYQFEYLKHSMGSFIDWKDVVKYEKVKKAVNE